MKRKGNWLLFLGLLIAAALLGIIFPGSAGPADPDPAINPGDVAWMLTASALVLIMTPGLGFFYGGMIHPRHILSTILQSFAAMGVVSVLWVVVGFSLAFGDSVGGIIGNPATYFMFHGVNGHTHPDLSPTISFALFAMFQLKFAIITPALITGSFAGRVRFRAYMLFICLFILFIYAPLAHMTWHPDGILRKWGILDFAGGTVVHMSAGFAALAGAKFLGKRKDYGSPIQPANISFVLLGAGLLWFGWFGFNAGSALAANATAALALMNTNTASAAAMLAYIFFDAQMGRKPSSIGASVGLVVGLVAITPAAGYVNVGASIFIGVLAAIVSNMVIHLFTDKVGLDDTLAVFPAHGVGGVMGMILTGIFAKDTGLIYGQTTTFTHHLIALAGISAFTLGGAFAIYWLTNKIVGLRVSDISEKIGLDLSQHDESYAFKYEEPKTAKDVKKELGLTQ